VFLTPQGLVAAVVVFFQVFRLERVTGEMVPTFVLRSSETADRRLASATPRSGTVDLATVTADDFPAFLGPEGRMALEHLGLLRDWEEQPPEMVWRQPIGAGWSAFAVRNGYAVTMEQRGEEELVTCYDVMNGELRWSHSIAARYQTALAVAGAGPRSTPTINEGWVWFLSTGAQRRRGCLLSAAPEALTMEGRLRLPAPGQGGKENNKKGGTSPPRKKGAGSHPGAPRVALDQVSTN